MVSSCTWEWINSRFEYGSCIYLLVFSQDDISVQIQNVWMVQNVCLWLMLSFTLNLKKNQEQLASVLHDLACFWYPVYKAKHNLLISQLLFENFVYKGYLYSSQLISKLCESISKYFIPSRWRTGFPTEKISAKNDFSYI